LSAQKTSILEEKRTRKGRIQGEGEEEEEEIKPKNSEKKQR
jgi:hypothetical protein